jgi:hypothetical protein
MGPIAKLSSTKNFSRKKKELTWENATAKGAKNPTLAVRPNQAKNGQIRCYFGGVLEGYLACVSILFTVI